MKYLAIDLGNVVLEVDLSGFLKKMSAIHNISTDDAYRFLEKIQPVQDLGLINLTNGIKNNFKTSAKQLKKLTNEWNNIIKPSKLMISFLEHLIKNETNIALLSNIGTDHTPLIRNIISPFIYDNSIKFFSCEQNARKPDDLYYKTFLNTYPEFKGCVYLDDRIENIEAGNRFGFNSYHFALDSFKSAIELQQKISCIEKLILDI
jgi:FMN phosphatase YigB (HAD superfamily)